MFFASKHVAADCSNSAVAAFSSLKDWMLFESAGHALGLLCVSVDE